MKVNKRIAFICKNKEVMPCYGRKSCGKECNHSTNMSCTDSDTILMVAKFLDKFDIEAGENGMVYITEKEVKKD